MGQQKSCGSGQWTFKRLLLLLLLYKSSTRRGTSGAFHAGTKRTVRQKLRSKCQRYTKEDDDEEIPEESLKKKRGKEQQSGLNSCRFFKFFFFSVSSSLQILSHPPRYLIKTKCYAAPPSKKRSSEVLWH